MNMIIERIKDLTKEQQEIYNRNIKKLYQKIKRQKGEITRLQERLKVTE